MKPELSVAIVYEHRYTAYRSRLAANAPPRHLQELSVAMHPRKARTEAARGLLHWPVLYQSHP